MKLHEEHEDEEKNTYEKDDEKEEKKEEEKATAKVRLTLHNYSQPLISCAKFICFQVDSPLPSMTLTPRNNAEPRPSLFSVNAPEFIPRPSVIASSLSGLSPISAPPHLSMSRNQSNSSACMNSLSSTCAHNSVWCTSPPARTVLSGPITIYSVYIGNLYPSTTEQSLRTLFSIVGEVHSIILPVHYPMSGRRAHFGFCQFTNESSAQNAVDMFNGHNGMVVLRYMRS